MAKLMSIFTTIPFGLLILTVFAYWRITADHLQIAGMDNLAYAVFGVGLILSWWFNRSRVFFITVVLALSHYALSGLAALHTGMPSLTTVVFPVICTLVPINILIFSLLKERGIFNFWGLGRFALIAFQLFYVAMAITANDLSLLNFFRQNVLTGELAANAAIPQPAVLAYGVAFLSMFRKQLHSRSHLDNALSVVLVASLLALQAKPATMAGTMFFSVAGIMLIIAVIQDSYSMAYLDELTGLPARRALKEELMKLRGEYTIAMVDIDFFKKFNDTYGHDTGDEVLRLVASVLKKVTGGGKAFRYGGEEFTIVFPHTAVADALPHLEKLRAAVEECPYDYRGKQKQEGKSKKKASAKKLFVTISIGVAERSEKHPETQEVIKAADNALYRAKKKGRNCVSK
ncbi:diguanylate cyclase [Sporomusa aerivorans]|uniref:GGDEF domain-containing protein n=1 Tax=Sporomusa aerivorans TaxID=204936 RepID=UPI00352A9AC3